VSIFVYSFKKGVGKKHSHFGASARSILTYVDLCRLVCIVNVAWLWLIIKKKL
jgi:hypothetical protein